MKLKFMWNGIKVDGKLYRARYSNGKLINAPEGTITIYAKDYDLPKVAGLNIENNTDLMTDYFEKDKVRVTPDNIHYAAVKEAMKKQDEHYRKRYEKKYGKA